MTLSVACFEWHFLYVVFLCISAEATEEVTEAVTVPVDHFDKCNHSLLVVLFFKLC